MYGRVHNDPLTDPKVSLIFRIYMYIYIYIYIHTISEVLKVLRH